MRRLLPLLLALSAMACDDDSSSTERDDADAAWVAPDGGVFGDVGVESDADGLYPSADASGDAGVLCSVDLDCGDRAWCEAGQCQPDRIDPVVALPLDGVTRVGAAQFDLTPPVWEPWRDRAGPDCPGNRPGRFEGRLDEPEPADPCQDGFDDLDGDGHFDAIWLGGDGLDRPAEALDEANPPAGRALVLARDALLRVVITLDVHAVDAARVEALKGRLRARLGLDEAQLLIHTTGTRSGPDAVGLGGPSLSVAGGEAGERLQARLGGRIGLIDSVPFASGVDALWWQAVVERSAVAAEQALRRAEAAQVRVALVELPLPPSGFHDGRVPDADADGRANSASDLSAWRAAHPWLVRDDHLPPRPSPRLGALLFESTVSARPLASVITWAAAPAANPRPVLSGDLAGAARALLEERLEAPAVWLTGANADTVLGGQRAFVPETDEAGRPVDEAGRPVGALDEAPEAADPAGALGRYLAGRALAALAVAESRPAVLGVRARSVWLPITNPRVGLAAHLGLLGPLADWLSGRAATRSWSSSAMTPACGGLGCARYRVERLDLGPVTLLTTPGALDGGLVFGQHTDTLDFADARNLRDLDNDGVADAEDDDIRLEARGTLRETTVHLPGPLNPQRVAAVEALAGERVWVVGRTSGGLGSLRPALGVPPVFEGQLEALVAYVQAPQHRGIAVCQLGYPCRSELDLGTLADLMLEGYPEALADVPGGHEVRLMDAAFVVPEAPLPWRVTSPGGVTKAEGRGLLLGPGDRAYASDADLYAAGVEPGDQLYVPEQRSAPYIVAGIVPVVLRDHPNAGDAWHAASAAGGDLVYNVACELMHDGACPFPQGVPDGMDPNETLPRGP